jgi:lipoprotein-releasing system permease protein
MNWVRFIARRYLKAKKNSKFLSLSTSLSMGGIGLGVAAIIVVLSVMKGFELQLAKKLVSTDLHLLLQPKADFPRFENGMIPLSGLDSLPAFASLKGNPKVAALSPMLSTEVIVRHGTKIAGVLLKGAGESRMKALEEKTSDRAMPQMLIDRNEGDGQRLPGIFIGKELADDLALIPGDPITVISPSMMDGPFSNIPRMKRFVVEGIYRFGSPEQELNVAYTPISNMESFVRRRAMVTEVEVTLKDASGARSLKNTYQSLIPEMAMKDWYDLNSSLFASMKLERIAMFMILLFTVMIASLNIVSTLTLMVQEKIRDVTILRIMGSTSKKISGVFIWKGVLIGGLGVAWGTAIAIVVCVLLRNTEIITLPDVYYDRTMPVSFEWEYFIGVPLVSFGIVLLASWFPAKKAAELTPMEGIRGI